MSLAQHVSSVEGVDQEYDDYSELPRLERFPSLSLSYDPLPVAAHDAAEKLETHQAAYEVPQARRIGKTLISCLNEYLRCADFFSLQFSSNTGRGHHLCNGFGDCVWV